MPSPSAGSPVPARRPHRNPRSLAARAEAAQQSSSIDLRRSAVLLTGLGVVLVALALAVLPWYDSAAGSSIVGGTYRDLRDVETLAELYGLKAPLVLRLYFGWLPMMLLIASIAAVAATAGPPPLRRAARVLAPLLGLASVVVTGWALQNIWHRVGGRVGFSIAGDSRVGMWAILAGFALLGLGGAIGLRRR